jgi:hypothetical protein
VREFLLVIYLVSLWIIGMMGIGFGSEYALKHQDYMLDKDF